MSETPVRQQLEESLSALVDGEAGELELRRLLKASDEEYAALRENWLSHQMASAALKKETPDAPFIDLSSSISAAIAEEPELSMIAEPQEKANTVVKKTSIWSGVGRFAVAASVAGAVVLGVQFAPSETVPQVAETAPVQTQPAVPSSFGNGIPADTTISTVSNELSPGHKTEQKDTIILNESTKQQLKEAAQEQVNRLILEHAQNASQNTQQGVLPYARVPETSDQ